MIRQNSLEPIQHQQQKEERHALQLQQNQYENKTNIMSNLRPVFVLHIGPHKTGSTTIQQNLKIIGNDRLNFGALLQQDHYLYSRDLPRYIRLFGNSFDTVYQTTVNSTRFLESMKRHCRSKVNLIVSNEFLSLATPPQSQHIQNALFNICQAWKLHIVLVYRRLHSLLPSMWNQIYKQHRPNFVNGMTAEQAFSIQESHSLQYHWPKTQEEETKDNVDGGDQEYRVWAFEEWYTRVYMEHPERLVHPTQYAYEAWRTTPHIDDVYHNYDAVTTVTILNMHDSTKDLWTAFVCDGLVNANHTCNTLLDSFNNDKKQSQAVSLQKRRRRETDTAAAAAAAAPLIANPSVDILDYDMLAVDAHAWGLINGTIFTRLQAAQALQAFHQTQQQQPQLHYLELPKKCPNETVLYHLYEWSLKSEQWYLTWVLQNKDRRRRSDDADEVDAKIKDEETVKHGSITELVMLTDQQRMDFDKDWQHSINQQLFCSVDTTKAVQMEGWKQFFQTHLQSN